MLIRMVSISWPRDPPTLASQSGGITGLRHRARPCPKHFIDSILSHQATYDPLHRTGKKHLKLHIESKESLHSQSDPKQKEQNWRHHATWLKLHYNHTVIKTAWHRYQNRYRLMEQNRGLRGNATHLQPSDLWQTWQKQNMGKGFPV